MEPRTLAISRCVRYTRPPQWFLHINDHILDVLLLFKWAPRTLLVYENGLSVVSHSSRTTLYPSIDTLLSLPTLL